MLKKIRSGIKGKPSQKRDSKKKKPRSGTSWGDVVFFTVLGALICGAIFYYVFYKPLNEKKEVSQEVSELRVSLMKEWQIKLIRQLMELNDRNNLSNEFVDQSVEYDDGTIQQVTEILATLKKMEEAGINLEIDSLRMMALISFKLGFHKDALELVDKIARVARDKDPGNEAESYYNKGKILKTMGKTREAFNCFEQSLKLGKSLITHDREMKSLIAIAELAMESTNMEINGLSGWSLAENYLRKALKLAERLKDDKTLLYVQEQYAYNYFRLGDMIKSINRFTIVQDLARKTGKHEKVCEILLKVGNIQVIMERFQDAYNIFKQVQNNPGCSTIMHMMGTVGEINALMEQGNWSKSVSLLDKLNTTNQIDESQLLNNWIIFLQARIMFNQNMYDKAYNLLTSMDKTISLSLSPDLYYRSKFLVTDILKKKSKMKSMLENLHGLIKKDPGKALYYKVEIYHRLGDAYLLMVNRENAKKYFGLALKGMNKIGMKKQAQKIRIRMQLVQF